MPEKRAGFAGSLLLAFALLTSQSAGAADDQLLQPVEPRLEVSDFELEDLDGAARSLDDYRGQVVLVNFWATWCPPCREEMPSMENLRRALEDEDFALLALNVGEDADTVFSFLNRLDPEPRFTILFDRDSAVLDDWPVRGLPTTFVLDRAGRITLRAVGGRHFDDPAIIDQIRALLTE
ncbi:MAG: TlpA disulfide reductase family protein [Wenzhouxiangella sp.]